MRPGILQEPCGEILEYRCRYGPDVFPTETNSALSTIA